MDDSSFTVPVDDGGGGSRVDAPRRIDTTQNRKVRAGRLTSPHVPPRQTACGPVGRSLFFTDSLPQLSCTRRRRCHCLHRLRRFSRSSCSRARTPAQTWRASPRSCRRRAPSAQRQRSTRRSTPKPARAKPCGRYRVPRLLARTLYSASQSMPHSSTQHARLLLRPKALRSSAE